MILLVGCGYMAEEYAKVLKSLGENFKVVGRGEASARRFREKTGIEAFVGGLDSFLSKYPLDVYKAAIVATNVEQLYTNSVSIIEAGIQNILVEKPAGLDVVEVNCLRDYARKHKSDIYVAYNRRFFSSVMKAKEIIKEDGGVESYSFEITEWGHEIATLKKDPRVLENWFLANTSHVVDLAYHLGGKPKEIATYKSGTSAWHSRSYKYAGAGVSDTGALFSYQGNWGGPGRWAVEVVTKNHRLIFKPLEKLQIQKLGSICIRELEIENGLDVDFKPGLYLQIKAFLEKNEKDLCSLEEHCNLLTTYSDMAGY